MFALLFDVDEVRQKIQRAFDGAARAFGGVAFMVLAMAAIQYDEIVAPEVGRLSDAWSTAATDFSRKLASFTL